MKNFTLYAKLILAQLICSLLLTHTLNAQTPMLYGMTQNGGVDSLGGVLGVCDQGLSV
jgi:hypothetical protein